MTSGQELLAGPYGRELCAAIAQESASGDVGIRATRVVVLAALEALRPEQVAALDERQVIAALETVVGCAVYWQEPRDDRERRVEAERRLAGLANWRATSGQWWSDPAFSGAAWTTPALPDLGPLRRYCTEDSLGWDRARAHPVDLDARARVFEVAGPDDWARLVDTYPFEVTHAKRGDWGRTTDRYGRWWIPDWPAVAEEYDAVHVSVSGYLATAGWAVPTADGATVLAGWGPGHACWLRPVRLAPTGVVEQ